MAFGAGACNALLDNGDATYVAADAAPDRDVGTFFEDAGSDAGLFAGKNGAVCIYSEYNCQLRADAGEDIVRTAGRDDDWGIDTDTVIRDGNGDALGRTTVPEAGVPRVSFQYGQRRDLADAGMHALAAKTSNDGPGWIALSDIPGLTSFKERMGPIINAQSDGLARMACYRILDRSEPDLEAAKFVYDAADKEPSGADYLPKLRANGRRSASLAFNVPGSVMRGTVIDHFPSGTPFQRLNVVTTFGAAHVDAPLWIKDADGRYRTMHDRQALPFVYGYVLTSSGEKRTGWMPYAALGPTSSEACD